MFVVEEKRIPFGNDKQEEQRQKQGQEQKRQHNNSALAAAVGGFRKALGAAEEHEGDGLLGVHAVFGLVEDDGLWAVEDGISNLRPAVCGQTVHEDRAGLCVGHQLIVDLEGNEDGRAACGLVGGLRSSSASPSQPISDHTSGICSRSATMPKSRWPQ